MGNLIQCRCKYSVITGGNNSNSENVVLGRREKPYHLNDMKESKATQFGACENKRKIIAYFKSVSAEC